MFHIEKSMAKRIWAKWFFPFASGRKEQREKAKQGMEHLHQQIFQQLRQKLSQEQVKQESFWTQPTHPKKAKNKTTSNSYCLNVFCNLYWLTLFFGHENQELPYQLGIFHHSLQVHSLPVCEQAISEAVHRTVPAANQNHFRGSKPLKSSMKNLKCSKLSLQCMENNPN